MSDNNLNKLIAQIKSEAIDSAEQEAKKILDLAKEKADKIAADAQKAKEQKLAEATKEADDIVNKGKTVLQQASRDLVIALRNELLGLCKASLEAKVSNEFKPEMLKETIMSVVNSIGSGVQFSLSPEMKKQLADSVIKDLQSRSDISVSEGPTSLKGLKITKTSEGWSYEISPESVTEALFPLLSANWVAILKEGDRS